jgi:hypothetical protein
MSVVGGIMAGVGAASSIGGAAISANAAGNAASTQAQAAETSAQLQATAEANALDFDKQVYSNAQGYAAPYQAQGVTALQALGNGTAPGGQFNSTPTSAQVMATDPGYQFNLEQGQDALERAEAAAGGVASGGALKAASQYATNYTTNAYQNAYTQFMNTRQANYGNLMSLAGLGESANALVTQAGTAAANNYSSTALTGANNQANYLTQGANAQAAGDLYAASAWNNALNGTSNATNGLLALGALGNYNQGSYQFNPVGSWATPTTTSGGVTTYYPAGASTMPSGAAALQAYNDDLIYG